MSENIVSSIDLSALLNQQCKDILKRCTVSHTNNKNLFVQHKNEYTLTTYFVRQFALANYSKLEENTNLLQRTRRPFENTFLSLKYSWGNDILEYDYKRFFDSPRVTAEKYNNFIGTFHIDVSDFADNPNHPALDRLLKYVQSTTDNIKYVFTVNTDNQSIVDKIYKRLSTRINRLEYVCISVSTINYVNTTMTLLKNKNYKINDDYKDILSEHIEKICKTKAFAGLESIVDFVDDIVCETYQMGLYHNVTAQQLREIINHMPIVDDDAFVNGKIGFNR